MAVPSFFYFNMISRISSKGTEVNLAFCVIQKFLQQTSKFHRIGEITHEKTYILCFGYG